MPKKPGKRQVSIIECADNSDDKHMCYGMDNQDEINYWYNKAQERKKAERKRKY